MDFVSAQTILTSAGVRITAGLTTAEFTQIEDKYGFRFPPDLRQFLSIGLPVSRGWVDWREPDEVVNRKRLDWPFDGMCYDIEHNVFCLEEWGEKPKDIRAAFEIARKAYQQAPKLIPIFSHRYIPAMPPESGNPVFSIHQTDIIYYGTDLLDYLQHEFSEYFSGEKSALYMTFGRPRQIEFWSKLTGE